MGYNGKGTREYLYSVDEIVNKTLRVVECIRMKNGKSTQKGYLVQSLIYPTAPTYSITEKGLKDGNGCSYSSGRRVCEESSLWGVEQIRNNIIDIEQAKNITPKTNKKITFKCSTVGCDSRKTMSVSTLVNNGFSCPRCSKGTSYPELFFLAVNQHFDLGFEYQVTYEHGRFDFINHDTKTIVEMNGKQHYKDCSWKNAHNTTKLSDEKKVLWSKNNNYTLIFIDCYKSEFNYIKNNINSCQLLPNIEEKDESAILKTIEKHSKYDTLNIIRLYTVEKLTTIQIGKIYNISHATVGNILSRNNIQIRHGVGGVSRKRVKCVETGIIYRSGSEAMRQTNIDISSITRCCSHKQKTAGGYHWEYVD